MIVLLIFVWLVLVIAFLAFLFSYFKKSRGGDEIISMGEKKGNAPTEEKSSEETKSREVKGIINSEGNQVLLSSNDEVTLKLIQDGKVYEFKGKTIMLTIDGEKTQIKVADDKNRDDSIVVQEEEFTHDANEQMSSNDYDDEMYEELLKAAKKNMAKGLGINEEVEKETSEQIE